MSPVERAAAVYQREACARTFREDLEAHLLHGVVLSTPDAFALCRPVCRSAEPSLILDPWHTFPAEECDAWFIYLAAGDFDLLRQWVPYPLPWIGWEKRHRIRWYRLTN